VVPEAIDDITGYWEVQIVDDADATPSDAKDGRVKARVVFPSIGAAVSQLIAWGRRIEIVEPDDVRERVFASARDILERAAR